MASPHFDALREKLLRAGIAPRHVRRYLKELRQHHDDLIAEEIAGGATGEEARLAARTRLGSDDELAAAMLAETSLRSVSARYPWAVFGLSPLLIVALVFTALFAAEIGSIFLWSKVLKLSGADMSIIGIPPAMQTFTVVWGWQMKYLTPLIAAIFLCYVAMRQRLTIYWLALGGFLCALGGSILTISMDLSKAANGMTQLEIGGGFNFNEVTLQRIGVNIAIIAILVGLSWWFIRQKADTSSA